MTSLLDVWLPSFSRSSGSIRMKVMCFSKRLGATDPAVQHHIPYDHSPKGFMHLIFCIEIVVCCCVLQLLVLLPPYRWNKWWHFNVFNVTLNVQEWQYMLEEVAVCDVRFSLNCLFCEVQKCTICWTHMKFEILIIISRLPWQLRLKVTSTLHSCTVSHSRKLCYLYSITF